MTDCAFCKIIAGQQPGKIVYQDESITAFQDIHPAAPVHILIVPNQHIGSVNEATAEHVAVLGKLFTVARQIAEQEGIQQSGYRLIVNTGPDSGQVVFHLHMHLLGGRHMRYPVG
ncbi:MAG: histidine triad nucleotide-binding protein [Anaerolineales bacterium]|nr:histidine triad nucleotide-binding protein [Anaerolineales bacterium]